MWLGCKFSPCSFGFVWLISRTFSANEQYFSLTPNQPTVLSVTAYETNRLKRTWRITAGGSLASQRICSVCLRVRTLRLHLMTQPFAIATFITSLIATLMYKYFHMTTISNGDSLKIKKPFPISYSFVLQKALFLLPKKLNILNFDQICTRDY